MTTAVGSAQRDDDHDFRDQLVGEPGTGQIAHHLSAREMRKRFECDEPTSFVDRRDRLSAEDGRFVGATRVSVGLATNFTEVRRADFVTDDGQSLAA